FGSSSFPSRPSVKNSRPLHEATERTEVYPPLPLLAHVKLGPLRVCQAIEFISAAQRQGHGDLVVVGHPIRRDARSTCQGREIARGFLQSEVRISCRPGE